ncbi:hypothetical protein UlMin_011209 [Ulmus minor]
MTSHNCFIILSLIIQLSCLTNSQASSFSGRREIHAWKAQGSMIIQHKMLYSSSSSSLGNSSKLRSSRFHKKTSHHHRHLKTAHGILIVIGWGTMLPIGAIIARYLRKFPMECEEWCSFHVICQSVGYILGTLGWFLGILVGKQGTDKTHGALGIVIFTFTTIQMLAVCWQPNIENECRKWWKIYHHVLGYALIALIIADIFTGMNKQSKASKWKWIYVGILGVLLLIALILEIFRWLKSKILRQTVQLNSTMYISP